MPGGSVDQAGRCAVEAGAGTRAKWSAPVLTQFVSVRVLTVGMDGSSADKNNNTKNAEGMVMSDRRAKENIVKMGRHPLGMGLYLFADRLPFRDRWRRGRGIQLGGMAEELEPILPEAVSVRSDGLKMVDYALIDAAVAAHP